MPLSNPLCSSLFKCEAHTYGEAKSGMYPYKLKIISNVNNSFFGTLTKRIVITSYMPSSPPTTVRIATLGGPPEPVIVILRDSGSCIRVSLYSNYTTNTGGGPPNRCPPSGWGVLIEPLNPKP